MTDRTAAAPGPGPCPLLVLVVASCVAAPAFAARPVTVDDLMSLRSIVEARVAPDGARVAYVLSQPSFEKDEHEAALFTVLVAGGAPERLAADVRIFNKPRPAPRLRWSPDGGRLSLLGFAKDKPQVFAVDLAGGAARQVTSASEGVSEYTWSPDGERIAYLSSEPPPEEEQRRREEKSFVIEVGRQERPTRLWVQEAAGGTARPVSPPEHFVAGLEWSPDGATLVYAASLQGGFMGQFHTRLYAVPAAGGEPRAIVERDGMNVSPQVSPDGRWVAFVSSGGRPKMVSTWGLHLVPAAGGAIRDLTPDTWVAEFAWAPDSGSLVVAPNAGPDQRGARMFEMPLLRVDLDGRREELVGGRRVHYSPSLDRAGRLLVFRSVEPRTMGDLFALDLTSPGSTPRRLTETNPELAELTLADLEPVHWTSSHDGMEIWGLLVTPPGGETRPLPLLVYLHGGPMGGFTYGVFPQFMHGIGQVEPYPVQAMASAGFAVLLPMPRGGAGYGEAGFHMIENAWGDGDMADVLSGVDALVAAGVADPERLGVMGASYGGYLTDWIVTQTDRFRAASVMCSISDIAGLYYLSDGGEATAEYFGLPWEAPEAYARHSPIHHTSRVTTPLLIQHGENDRRVPLMQATQFYKALERQGKTVELEIYPRGGHVIYEPDLEREMMRRNLEWFRRWIEP